MASVGTSKSELVDLDVDLVDVVLQIGQEYDKEDRLEREERRPLWMKLENYFNGLQRIYWNMVAKDWRLVDEESHTAGRSYDRIVNMFRAHGESIIAALSIKTPSAIFYPDDADVDEDVTTAKICVKIKENIERQNHAQLLTIKSFLIFWCQGTVFAYIYNRKDSKYGTYSNPKYSKEGKIVHTTLLNCTECGSNIDEVVSEKEKIKIPEEEKECPTCGNIAIPNQEEYEEVVPEIIGSSIESKSKTCIDLYSPLYVYAPFYAKKQEHVPYVRLRTEQHFSMLRNIYPRLAKRGLTPSVDNQHSEERQITVGLNSSNLCTVDCWWVRDWAFDIIYNNNSGGDDKIKRLKKLYPDGYYAVVIDGELVEIHNENLDDHWEISSNPLSNYIHAEPLGKPLAPIQDIKNEVTDLQIETLEHAIPETHARADVVNFEKYSKSKAQPGMLYPTMTPADGTRLSDAFHTLKTATLSEESELFSRKLDNEGQFVVGSFPSIYGGPATSGSKTAREYTESRSMALQRLSLPWNVHKFFWANVISKAVPLYIHALKKTGQDERVVERQKTGFINNWIRQSDLNGRIGRVEADAEEGLPVSAAQLKDVIISLMTLKDDFISEALYHPQNSHTIAKALGSPDFYIPGSDDRDKQYAEFSELLSGVFVEVNEKVDKHAIEAETCRSFLVSPTGMMIKRNNPEGWSMIEEHMSLHIEMIVAQTSPESVKSEGEEDVETI